MKQISKWLLPLLTRWLVLDLSASSAEEVYGHKQPILFIPQLLPAVSSA
jgi:hypothetical protein